MIQVCDIKIQINPDVKVFYKYFDREDFCNHTWTKSEVEYVLNCGIENAKVYSCESYFHKISNGKLIKVYVSVPFSDVKIPSRETSGLIYVNFDIETNNKSFQTGVEQFIESNIYSVMVTEADKILGIS